MKDPNRTAYNSRDVYVDPNYKKLLYMTCSSVELRRAESLIVFQLCRTCAETQHA